MCDLILVNGCNSKYFQELFKNLTNIFKIIQNTEHKIYNIKLIFYDLGLTKEEINKLKNNFDFLEFNKFNFKKYPEHVDLNIYFDNNCSYAWKPIIINEVCQKYNTLIYWFDTRSYFNNFTNIIEILKTKYIYSPISTGPIKNWTHPTTIKLLKAEKYLDYKPRAGGIIGINSKIDWCKNLIKDWKELSLNKDIIIPDGSSRLNHRQDQSIISILYYIYLEKYKFDRIDNYININPHYY
tara:strand:- start:753 stop:1469 length:717 start_codon:yes stop_codon:yes gene_type:complete